MRTNRKTMEGLENVRSTSWDKTIYPFHTKFWYALDWSQEIVNLGYYKIRDFIRDNVDNAYARRIHEQSETIEWKD